MWVNRDIPDPLRDGVWEKVNGVFLCARHWIPQENVVQLRVTRGTQCPLGLIGGTSHQELIALLGEDLFRSCVPKMLVENASEGLKCKIMG